MGVDRKEDIGVSHTNGHKGDKRPTATCWVSSNSGSHSSVDLQQLRGVLPGLKPGSRGFMAKRRHVIGGVHLMPGQSVSVPDTAARLGVAPSRGFTLALLQGAICGSQLLGDDGDAFIS